VTAVKILARQIIIQVSDGAGTPTWLSIAGINSAKPNPGEAEEAADIGTFDSNGYDESMPAQRGATLETEGLIVKDDTTGAQNPGQARCEALAAQIGYQAHGSIRFRHPMDTAWKVWTAWVSLSEQGGAKNDPDSWGVKFMRSGAPSTMAVV